MSTFNINRRSLLKKLAYGGIGGTIALEQLAGVPGLATWFNQYVANPLNPINRFDSYAMMGNALSGGPAMLGVHKAMAAAEDGWALVQIKVCNHVYTPLVFKMGKFAAGNVTSAADVQLASARMTTGKAALIAKGVDSISDIPRYQELRLNKWFADMMHNGTADGLAPTTANLLGLDTADVAPFSGDKVALQAFLGLSQNETNNHALKACKLRPGLPDVTLFAQEKGLIESPLGISCFMMGNNYDKAEGAININSVLGDSTTETAVVSSRTVAAYVAQIQQYVGKSYADRASIEQNVIYRMDKLVDSDPVLRRDLINSITQFRQGLDSLRSCSDLETSFQTMNTATANVQSRGNAQTGASSEFLGQCKYVASSLELPGVPVRNFSLFLNISDLDGRDLDVGFNGGGGGDVRAFSYVEGMRQLAMGMNILGKKIAEGKKMIVVISSEGGRGSQMNDSKASFAMVMGPKGAGMLSDKLFANMASVDSETNAIIKDMAAPAAAMEWDVDGLMGKDNTKATGTPSTGDVQMGVVQFLEDKVGKNVRKDLSATDGQYVKLARQT